MLIQLFIYRALPGRRGAFSYVFYHHNLLLLHDVSVLCSFIVFLFISLSYARDDSFHFIL